MTSSSPTDEDGAAFVVLVVVAAVLLDEARRLEAARPRRASTLGLSVAICSYPAREK
ncbi:hypothetical protein [Hansschlegelia plantiphila]|uniref:hypothetical protein n=1 Tax=Hansschlegelia plantiphila TaxID=374655 RepID=UPI0022F2A35F|nr:hypothetical protein [Hansschlegelia plantiphila]